MFGFVNEIKDLFDDDLFNDIVAAFGELRNLWKQLMFDVLKQDTCGWNNLQYPIDKSTYSEIVEAINMIKETEITAIQRIDNFLQNKNDVLLLL